MDFVWPTQKPLCLTTVPLKRTDPRPPILPSTRELNNVLKRVRRKKNYYNFFPTTVFIFESACVFKVHTVLNSEGHVGPPTHTGTFPEHLFLPWVCVCVSDTFLLPLNKMFPFFPFCGTKKKSLSLLNSARFSQHNQLTGGPSSPQSNVFYDSVGRYEDGVEFLPLEADVCDGDAEAYVTNLSYYHLVPFETDILE